MKTVILYSLLIIATVQFAVSIKSQTKYRVIGGSKAKLGQFPFVVKLRPTYADIIHCGASIISSTILLTAAHCFCLSRSHEILYAEVGIVDSVAKQGKLYKIKNSICHEDWKYIPDINKSTDDIALGRIDGEIQFTPNVQSIKISHAFVPTGEMVTLVGYGCTSFENTDGSKILLFALIKKISMKDCRKMYEYADRKLMCTYTQGKQACFGDSGTPIVYKQKLVGISINGNESDNPDLHIAVKSYLPWIEKTIKLLN